MALPLAAEVPQMDRANFPARVNATFRKFDRRLDHMLDMLRRSSAAAKPSTPTADENHP